MKLTQQHFFGAVRGLVLLVIIGTVIRTVIEHGANADLVFYCILGVAWFGVSFFIYRGIREFRWAKDAGCNILVLMDTYFLISCLISATEGPVLATRALGLYVMFVLMVTNPKTAVLAAVTGLISFYSMVKSGGAVSSVQFTLVLLSALAGLICGAAWKFCLPLLWKGVQLLLWPPAVTVASPAPDPATVSEAALSAAPASASPSPSPGAAAPSEEIQTQLNALKSEVDNLRQMVKDRDAAIESLTKEKDKLTHELELTADEMLRTYHIDDQKRAKEETSA